MTSKANLQKLTEGRWLDKGLEGIANDSKSSEDLFKFIFAFQHLCVSPAHGGHGANAKKMRSSAWQSLDNNNNGIVSLAETGKFIKDHLAFFFTCGENKHLGIGSGEAERLYKLFYPCFIRAFLDAADYGAPSKVTQKGGGKSYSNTKTTGDDFVQFKEFRLLVTYLCIYATIYEAFGVIDGGKTDLDDRRISKAEWNSNRSSLISHPLDSLSVSAAADPEKVFAAMDGDGKGMVLLAEFSTYIEDYEFALGSRWGKLLNAGEPVKASTGAATAAGSS